MSKVRGRVQCRTFWHTALPSACSSSICPKHQLRPHPHPANNCLKKKKKIRALHLRCNENSGATGFSSKEQGWLKAQSLFSLPWRGFPACKEGLVAAHLLSGGDTASGGSIPAACKGDVLELVPQLLQRRAQPSRVLMHICQDIKI